MSYEEALEKIKQAAESGASELVLQQMRLEQLPPEIGRLTNLQKLDVSYNGLTTLPPEIGHLTHLQTFIVSHNHLEVLPPEIWQLTNLQYFDLTNNHLTMLPREIGKLTQLRGFGVENSCLTILPPDIGQLADLLTLDLSHNQLTTLPPEIGQLADLVHLDLSHNQLTTLPLEIGQLADLVHLDLSHNQLTTLPPEIGQLNNLQRLFLNENPLHSWSEQGPSEVRHFYARNCPQLTTLPSWLKQASKLDVRGCERLSDLPDHLCVTWWIDLGGTSITSLPAATTSEVEILWYGVRINQHVAFEPKMITVQEVFAEPNLEVRRVMIERMGQERFMREAEPEELDKDFDSGGVRRLLRVELPDGQGRRQQSISDEPFVGLEVRDPSTGRQYILRVPPDMATCQQAAAWIAGFDNPEDYRPVQET